jgi:hypothetical protein
MQKESARAADQAQVHKKRWYETPEQDLCVKDRTKYGQPEEKAWENIEEKAENGQPEEKAGGNIEEYAGGSVGCTPISPVTV